MKKVELTVRELIAICTCSSIVTLIIISMLSSSCTRSETSVETCKLDTLDLQKSECFCEWIDDVKEEFSDLELIGAASMLNIDMPDATIQNVREVMMRCDPWYPDIIMAQYQLESDWGRSDLANRNNNLFGMRKAFTRKSVRCKAFDSKGYAVYNSWPLSVVDRVLWDCYEFKEKPTRAQYLNKIAKIYAEDRDYIDKIEEISKKYR